MTAFLAAIGLLVAGGAAALALSARPRLALAVGSATAAAGGAVGLIASLPALRAAPAHLDLPWPVPNGAFAVGLDPLSALFASTVFAIGLAAAVFGAGTMRAHASRRPLGSFAFFFNLLLASMALLVAARQAVLFLVAWETMTIASFSLVAFDDAEPDVRRASRTYVFASRLGTAFLFALFLLLAGASGSLRFDAFAAHHAAPGVSPTLVLVLALLGFGTKAGLVPLHVWLPEAHPAAPSHVSALMSGVLVKMGVYGILRVLTFLPPPPAWHGLLVAGVGLAGATAALALALGQRDVKRVLAYSTVENVGLVALGVGIGLTGAALGSPGVAALGLAGALLHVWNHAFMKGLAFLGVGSLAHAAHTRDAERMGGLLRRLPVTGGLLVLAAASLAALPPLNGFVSEWLLAVGLLRGGTDAAPGLALPAHLALAALVFAGALATVVFTRLIGTALLGEPRSAAAASAREGGPLLLAPLAVLGAANLALALFPAQAVALVGPAAAQVLATTPAEIAAALAPTLDALAGPMRIALGAAALAGAALALAARRLRAGREVRSSTTWGCGFSAESPRVQYTAASFAELSLRAATPGWLRPTARVEPPEGPFPRGGSFALAPEDPARERLFVPVFLRIEAWFARLRLFQQARLNLQLVLMVATVLALSLLLLRGRLS